MNIRVKKMMSNKTAELEDGECCCCLERGEHRDVTKQYYWDEQPEIYEVLFKDTFDIVLKYPESTKLICECCIVKLREASHFRSMVESSQQSLIDRHNLQIDIHKDDYDTTCTVKIESIKYEPDNKMQEVHTQLEELVLAEGVDITSDNLDGQETFNVTIKTENIKWEIEDEERRSLEELITEELDIKSESSDFSPPDNKRGLTQHKLKPLSVVLIRRPSVERLASYNRSQYKHSKSNVHDHSEERSYSCNVCQYKTTTNTQLTAHMESHTDVQYEIRTIKKEYLNRHLLTHTGKKPYSCDSCHFKTAAKSYLDKHMRTHAVEKPYSCNFCQYKTIRKYHLKVHLRIHTGERNFTCNFCQYKATTQKYLNDHLRTHTGEKPYSCNYCRYKTSRYGDLSEHLRTHTGERPYSCDFCEYKAKTKRYLKIHLSTHTGDKPYSCDFCQYKTARERYLKLHLRIHTREKPYSCDICQYKASVKDYLKIHLRKHKD